MLSLIVIYMLIMTVSVIFALAIIPKTDHIKPSNRKRVNYIYNDERDYVYLIESKK